MSKEGSCGHFSLACLWPDVSPSLWLLLQRLLAVLGSREWAVVLDYINGVFSHGCSHG